MWTIYIPMEKIGTHVHGSRPSCSPGKRRAMKKRLLQWFTANKAIFLNTGSLIGTWGVTSGLGFVYWWLAAREFSPQDVGIGSASISAMTLIGTFCLMGLGTLLITELPRQPERAGSLIST